MTEMSSFKLGQKPLSYLNEYFWAYFFNEEGQALNLCHTQSSSNLIAPFQLH